MLEYKHKKCKQVNPRNAVSERYQAAAAQFFFSPSRFISSFRERIKYTQEMIPHHLRAFCAHIPLSPHVMTRDGALVPFWREIEAHSFWLHLSISLLLYTMNHCRDSHLRYDQCNHSRARRVCVCHWEVTKDIKKQYISGKPIDIIYVTVSKTGWDYCVVGANELLSLSLSLTLSLSPPPSWLVDSYIQVH